MAVWAPVASVHTVVVVVVAHFRHVFFPLDFVGIFFFFVRFCCFRLVAVHLQRRVASCSGSPGGCIQVQATAGQLRDAVAVFVGLSKRRAPLERRAPLNRRAQPRRAGRAVQTSHGEKCFNFSTR